MKIKLTRNEFELLSEGRFLSQELLGKVRGSAVNGDAHALDVSEDDADFMREACVDELQRSGFDAKGEPTKRGLLLESLIDKFFTG